MSIPALRQPNLTKKDHEKTPFKLIPDKRDFFIVTLKGGKKLVVSSDAYHGILTAGGFYRCVFCESEMVLDILCKERHKSSQNHRKILENYPHVEEYKENLIRKITASTNYCTVCNVIVLSHFLQKHVLAEAHIKELNKALTRAESYKERISQSDEYPPLSNYNKNKI
ncbi:unnamed protein product [Arctia plantaginis]|uniref:Uncharacterized protein n=1 Tax=Arctia plantaginis TaxID=874455 RepID=A0A8S1A0Y7_ARCPL|nr:unnamed protein product [Arctia plantaginis]